MTNIPIFLVQYTHLSCSRQVYDYNDIKCVDGFIYRRVLFRIELFVNKKPITSVSALESFEFVQM